MFSKLLVANRGEIAVRVIRACRELGIATVAVYSDADAHALHVRLADEAIRLGPAPASQSYLDQAAVIAAATRSGAAALHPGYGFLSENGDFADRCRAAGVVFVGPSGDAMRLMGDKAAARNLARSAGVPVVEGYDGAEQADTRLAGEARRIGYPVLIKPAMGGGGMAMHAVERPSMLRAALAQARREATAAFDDDRLILERLVKGPRHIEVQVLGDEHGSLIALGERDCSTQRRHQKVIEESPSPVVDEATRQRFCDLALAIARAAGYTSAGTVEFLRDANGSIYFLEMNTRLQVEHPVTEAVYGVDLVRLQIEIAVGRRLEPELLAAPRGHAIECRLYAEDPANGFAPSTGRVLRLRLPEGPGIRNDVGIAEGDEIGPYYDAMLGKLIVWAPDRAAAFRRMDRALADTVVLGVKTNQDLLRQIMISGGLERGEIDIDFLERNLSALLSLTEAPDSAFAAAVAAQLLDPQSDMGASDPWRLLGPWRLSGWETSQVLECNGIRREVRASRRPADATWHLQCDDETWVAALDGRNSGSIVLGQDGRLERFEVLTQDAGIWVASALGVFLLHRGTSSGERDARRPEAARLSADVDAPMPGVVRKVYVRADEKVRAHQVLVVLEAMKMEHAIEAPADGVVREVHCREGDLVQAGARLVDLEG